jgi:hypothetical protein
VEVLVVVVRRRSKEEEHLEVPRKLSMTNGFQVYSNQFHSYAS